MRKTPHNRTWQPLLFSLIALAILAVASENVQASSSFPSLLAQPASPGAAGKPVDKTMIYKGVGIAAGVLVVVFVVFFVVYPSVLKKGDAWPVSLYGRCACVAWILCWAIALIVLWKDLPIHPFDTFWKEQGLRSAFIAIGLVFGFTWLFLWKSESQKK
jgi:hypothetical protein